MLKDARAVYTPGISERASGTSKFYHADALGSTRGITNGSQTVTDAILYDAFGMTVSRTGSTPTPFGFVGAAQYQSDADSGLQLLGNRLYDPSIGRFISSDPAKAGTSWYCYCGDCPLGKVDPTGLQPNGWAILGGIVVGVGVSIGTGNPVLGVMAGFGTSTVISLAMGDKPIDAIENGSYGGLGTMVAYPILTSAISAGSASLGGAGLWGISRGGLTPQQIGNIAHDDEYRNYIEEQYPGVRFGFAPPNGGGPDVINHDYGMPDCSCPWEFAELKPDNLRGVDDGLRQIIGRGNQGFNGPGQLYLYRGAPGSFDYGPH